MALQPSTTNLALGTWPAGTSVVRTVTLTGATGAVSAQISGSGAAAYTVVASPASAIVTFNPSGVGGFPATLTVSDAGSGTTTEVALSGNARVNALTFTPSPLAFGDVIVGAPTNLSLNIENPGPLDATLSIAVGPFTMPVTSVPANQTANLQVFFTPPSTGPFSATMSAAWAPPADPTGVTLPALPSSDVVNGNGVLAVATQTSTTGVSGTRQRLLVEVPNPPAQMTLGARVLDTNASNPSAIIDGFGLGTPGHGFLNTHGEASNLWMRAMKSLVLEARASDSATSSEGIWMVSNGNLAATCAGTASFIGAGGVVIAANKGPAPGEDGNPTDTDSSINDPPATGKAEDRQGIASKASLAFGSIDAIIAFSFGVRGLYNLIKGAREDSKLPFTSLAATVGLAGAAGGFAGFSVGVSGLAGKLSGVTIYGEAGVVIGSGGFTGIHSISSLVLTSVFPLMFGVDAEIFAVDALTMTGMRHVTLASHKDVAIQSDGDVKIKANGGGFGPIGSERTGKIEVQAKEKVRIEATTLVPPASSFLEIEVAQTTLETDVLKITTGSNPGLGGNNPPAKVYMGNRIDLGVRDYGARIRGDQLQLGKIVANGGPDPAGPNLMVRNQNITLRYGNQGAVGVTDQGQVKLLAGGQQHKIIMGPATVRIQSAARILLQ